MASDDNIKKLVQDIWHPDIEETIPHSEHLEQHPYQFLLKELCLHAKACIRQEMLNPYIQLKNEAGTYLFNDRLTISSEYNNHSKPQPKDYSFDFIFDQNPDNRLYCLMQSFYESGECLEGFMLLNAPKPIPTLTLSDFTEMAAPMVKEDLQQQQKPLSDKMYVKIMVHHYSPKTQDWKMILPDT